MRVFKMPEKPARRKMPNFKIAEDQKKPTKNLINKMRQYILVF
jgi:hypothetical protein